MLGLFYQYLIHHQRIVLPGLGTVVLQRKPATSDFADHVFLPPSYSFHWENDDTNPPAGFFVWLSRKLNVAEEEAAINVNNFIAELKREMNAGKEITWEGVGIIRRGMESGIEFESSMPELPFENKVHGEKVIHEHTSHNILVGDKEKTSFEMTEILHLPVAKRFNWFRVALIASILSLLFIIWYIWKNGFAADAVSNQKKITPKEAPASYEQK
jgi:hypothetical protein